MLPLGQHKDQALEIIYRLCDDIRSKPLDLCGSAYWWARQIEALSHEVVLLHARFIRPFVQNSKTDGADARVIWTAVQQPGMSSVAPKTEEQRAMLGMHRTRALLVKAHTMQINQLPGLMYELA